jgi:O-antigen/teichoic acid export membrane protein
VKLVVLVVLPVASFLVVFAEPLLDVWIGAELADQSAWPLRLLAAGFAVSAFGTIPAVACDAVGRPGVPTAFSVVGAVFNVSLSLALIPFFGIVGAAAVNLVHSLVGLPLFLLFVHRRVLRIPLRDLLRRTLARPLLAAALAWLPMVALLPLAETLAGLVLAFAVGVIAFAVAAVLVGVPAAGGGARTARAGRRAEPAVAAPEAVS